MSSYKYEQHTVVIVLMTASFLISAYLMTNNAAFWWDEAEYGIISRGLTSDGFLGFFGQKTYRPPFLPIYESIAYALIGKASWFLIIPFFSAMSIASVYLIARKFFGFAATITSTILLLFSTLFIFYSGRFLTEIPGLFFSSLAIYFYYIAQRDHSPKYFAFFGLASLLGFLVFYRFLLVLFSIAVYTLIFKFSSIWTNFKHYMIPAAIFILGLIPMFIYGAIHFNSPIGIWTLTYAAGEPVPPEWFITSLPHILSNNFVVILFIFSLLYALIYGKPELKYFALLSVVILVSASVLINHKEDRYLIPMFPAVFIAIGAFASEIITLAFNKIKSLNLEGGRFEKSAFQIAFSVIVILMLFMATFNNAGAAFQLYGAKKDSFGDVKEAALYVRDNSPPDATLMSDSVTAMFHSERHSAGFIGGNLTAFLMDLEKHKPSYLLITVYESRDTYINALTNANNIQTPVNSIEYVLVHPERFVLKKIYPSEASPYVLVFEVVG